MVQLTYDDGRVNTIHIQTGPEVYIFESDEILPNDEFLLDKVMDYKEVQGTAQGQGIETVWWDTTEMALDRTSTAQQLQERGRFVRSLNSATTKEAKTRIMLRRKYE